MADPIAPPVPPPHPPPPAPPALPAAAATAGATAGVFTRATADRDTLYDAFYLDDRNPAVPKSAHPRKAFYNRFNHFAAAPPSDDTIQVATGQLELTNPLNDPGLTLPQRFADLGTNDAGVRHHFDELRPYYIFVPAKVREAANADPTAPVDVPVSVFFGVEPEINLFGLCAFFENAESILITVPGIELWDTSYGRVPWGIGITDAMIRRLLDEVSLGNVNGKVAVMAGYSTGYRGVNLTIINKTLDLSALRRLVYYDAFYRHDDHPLPPSASPHYRNNTRWAVDTAFAAAGGLEVVIYGLTGAGTPRQAHGNEPKAPLKQLLKDHASGITFVDLEFPRAKKPALADQLEKICLARLVQGGIGDYFPESAVPAGTLDLIGALPPRGMFGTLGRAGFTDLYTWITSAPGKDVLGRISIGHARDLVARFGLLGNWTVTDTPDSPPLHWYEMRHREFVQEIGKEALLP